MAQKRPQREERPPLLVLAWVIAGDAITNVDGSWTLHTITHSILAAPDGTVRLEGALYFFALVMVPGEHRLQYALRRDKGEVMGTRDYTVTTGPDRGGYVEKVTRLDMSWPGPVGLYWFELQLDGRIIVATPLEVHPAPAILN